MGATKRKAPEEQLSVPKVTAVERYLQLISDITDKFPEMRGCFIVMGNVPEMFESIIMQKGVSSTLLIQVFYYFVGCYCRIFIKKLIK